MRASSTLSYLVVVAAAAGCEHLVDSPRPPGRLPLIEAVLVAGSEVSRFRLRWLDPDDDETLSPVLPEDVALELRTLDGTRATWEPDPDSSGIYLATLPIAATGTYRLGGTIGGRPIGGATRVPGHLDLEPAGDTLFVTGAEGAPESLESGRIVVRWRAAGATVLVFDSAAVLFAAGFTHAGNADLGIRQSAPGQRVGPTIRFVAMNRDGDRYQFNVTGPETNLTGAFGVFGGAAETPEDRRMALIASVALAATIGTEPVRGTVVAAEGSTPIANASIVARRSRSATTSDRLGRFTIVTSFPDTLVIAAIGWRPDTIPIPAPPSAPITVVLERSAVVISDLIAAAPAARPLELSDHGRWRMPMAAARTVPPAVETDVYRALAMIPAVSFSSPLSARPLVRGYDAQEVTTRIDGFEVLNLYHLGRIFSSFPADAAEEITVSAAPYTAAHGGSTAGLIDINGRTGRLDRFQAGGGLSYGSLSGYAGGGNATARYFGNARVFYWKSLELIPSLDIPYHFEDLYGSLVLGPADRPRARLTAFATRDRAGPSNGNRTFLNWDNAMLGGRWRLKDGATTTFDVSASAAHFGQTGEDVPGLHSMAKANLRNRFTRLAATGDLVAVFEMTRLASGIAVGWRNVVNQIADAPLDFNPDPNPFGGPRTSIDGARLEVGGYASASHRLGPFTAEAALRVDAAGAETSVQPRFHARWAPSKRIELSVGAGRTSRLFHLLGDARSEPDFDFLDFWLPAGDSVPTAQTDHLTVDLNLDLAPFLARISVFRSRGSGIGELTPETAQRQSGPFEFFRFGRSRTRGVEAQLAYRGRPNHPRSLSVSYAMGRSERDWGEGWVRWSLDRTHQVRAFGQFKLAGVTWFGAFDAAAGSPITPIDFRLDDTTVPGQPHTVVPGRAVPVAVYGRENAAATSGTFRIDVGLGYSFGGPHRRRFTLGASVINVFATAVSPFGYVQAGAGGSPALDRRGAPTPYQRLFTLPPIPTLTLRAEF